jgi:hypothetical protein
MRRNRRIFLAGLAAIALTAAAGVAPTEAGRFVGRQAVRVAAGLDWNRLSPTERRALQREWDQASPERRRQLLNNVERLRGMSPEQQRALREQAEAFQRLSPDEQRRTCDRYYRERGWVPPVCRSVGGQR